MIVFTMIVKHFKETMKIVKQLNIIVAVLVFLNPLNSFFELIGSVRNNRIIN